MNPPIEIGTSGSYHRCVCGRPWSESDGGPCHIRCAECGCIYPAEEVDQDGICVACLFISGNEGSNDYAPKNVQTIMPIAIAND